MAELKLTEEQKAVVDARDCSLLVAAAAGSGKTAVLVKRIIEKLTNKDKPVNLDRMLIVTFTKAAAAEMRERIGKALDKAVEENPLDENLRKQLAMLPTAQISTIDSFCMSVVKENYHSLMIDPGFRIEDESVLQLLAEDVLTEYLDEEYERDSDEFRHLLSSYTSHKDDAGVKELILSLYRYADSDPRPDEWLNRAEEDYSRSVEESSLPDYVFREAERVISDCMSMCLRAVNIAGNKSAKGPEPCLKALNADREMLEELLNAQNFDSLYESMRDKMNFPMMKGPTSKQFEEGLYSETLTNVVKAVRESYKDCLKTLKTDYFSCPLSETEAVYKKTAPAMLELIRLTREFSKRFDAEKADRNAYGFSDVAHFAHRILCTRNEDGEEVPTDTARSLAGRYDEIMIDEYQDSSFLQEYTLKAVSGEFGDIPNLFMVGDVKQSIYGFRKARPELFNRKYHEFEETGLHRKIDLSKNFRSRKCVLDSVNVIMSGIMHEDISEIEYDEKAALHFGSGAYTEDSDEYSTELMLIDSQASEEEVENISRVYDLYERIDSSKDEKLSAAKTTAIEREALCTALKIKDMVANHFQVADGEDENGKKKTRNVTYNDFAVLIRSAREISEVFTRVFTKLHIPSAAETGTGFFDSTEVRKTLSFLRILDNPYQDIAFAAVLYSPFVSMNAEEVAELVVRYGDKSGKALYDCARLASADGNKKLERFFELYDRLIGESEYMTVHEVLERLYEAGGYKDIVSIQPQGDRRSGNLDQLVSIAKTYENSTFTGVHDFLRYVDRLMEGEKDFGEATSGTTEGCVRIMTIHKSKGLEFPVVFVCRMGGKFNKSDSKRKLIFDQDFGIGSNYIDVQKRTKQKTLKQSFLQNRKKHSDMAEEVRVLYVALTRAKEKLFMVGSVDKPCEKAMQWQNALVDGSVTYSYLDKAGTYMDLVAPVVFSGLGEKEFAAFENGSAETRLSRKCGTETFEATFKVSLIHFDETSAHTQLEGDTEYDLPGTEPCGSILEDPDIVDEINARKEFVYPYSEQAKAPVKVSVSELKMIAIHDMEEEKAVEVETLTKAEDGVTETAEAEVSGVLAKKGISGAERGTLYHEVLEKIRYTGDYSNRTVCAESLASELQALISEGYLPKDIQETVSLKKLTAFCMSSIGQRMICAFKEGKLYREQPFVYGLSNEEFREFAHVKTATETVMLQGIIDAYIDEGDDLVLIDYKTDKVYADAVKELTERYSVQLELYARALSKLRGKPVKEKVIYSVAKNEVVVLD